MTLDYERKGVRILNESALDDFVDELIAMRSQLSAWVEVTPETMMRISEALQLAYKLPHPWMGSVGISYDEWEGANVKIDAAIAEINSLLPPPPATGEKP